MEDSIFSFLGGEELKTIALFFLSMSCSAIVSLRRITFHSIHLPKPPNAFRKNITKRILFNKIQQTVKSSSSSTHYLVLTNQGKYLLTHISTHPSPSTLNPHLFFSKTFTHTNSTSTSPRHHPYNYDSSLHTPLHFHRYLLAESEKKKSSSKKKSSFEREMSPTKQNCFSQSTLLLHSKYTSAYTHRKKSRVTKKKKENIH